MNNYISIIEISGLFELLILNKIQFILLRNINDELPNRLSKNKDIDILINPIEKNKLISVLVKSGWKQVSHPWDFGNNFIFLYSMDPFLFFKKGNINIDIHFQLACRSLNKGEWFPLDEAIQKSVWKNKTIVSKIWKFELSDADKIIHFVTRSIFDKKKFEKGYIIEIEKVFPFVDKKVLMKKLKVVFFKFSEHLYNMLLERNYEHIIKNYIEFKDY